MAIWLGSQATGIHAQPSANQLNLPTLGEAGLMSLGDERDLGDRIARELYRDPSAADDYILSEYLDQIWQPLLQAARARGDIPPELDARMAWRVVQIRDGSVNAFALPGGYLGVHHGLIGVTQDRSELATVMAHELSHVTQRHIARSIDQQNKLTPLMMAAVIAGAMAASKNPAAGQALAVGGQAAFIQQGLNFSRDMEREADRVGYNQLRDAGFSTDGAVRMFERLQTASRLNDSGAWPYLRTHPLTSERIGDMQTRHAGQATRAPDDLLHRLMASRARVLAETDIDALRKMARPPHPEGFTHQPLIERASHLYQVSMSQAQLRDFANATATAKQLLALSPDNADLHAQARLLLADIAQRQGLTEQTLYWLPATSVKSVSQSLSLQDVVGTTSENRLAKPYRTEMARQANSPSERASALWRAQALLAKAETVSLATGTLQNWVARHPTDAAAWRLLSRAWTLQGKHLRALRAQAEESIARADWTGAQDRLQAAQEASRVRSTDAGAHIEASIIDIRLKWVSEKVRLQAEADARRQ